MEKKKQKLKMWIRLLVLGAIIKSKIDLAVKFYTAALQTKMFFLLLGILFIQKVKLILDLKKPQEPSKAVYYEHAQHDHHYEDDWGEDHHQGWLG